MECWICFFVLFVDLFGIAKKIENIATRDAVADTHLGEEEMRQNTTEDDITSSYPPLGCLFSFFLLHRG